jgi:hypothetical protein
MYGGLKENGVVVPGAAIELFLGGFARLSYPFCEYIPIVLIVFPTVH